MKTGADIIEIPTAVFDSLDTLDGLQDWLMAKNARVMELSKANREDLAGEFKSWKPRHLSDSGKSE